MSLLEHPFAGPITPWPKSLDVPSVLAHKSHLIVQGDVLFATFDNEDETFTARCVYRGAAVWERWLVDHMAEGAELREARMVSAVSLAERAGDWKLTRELLDLWVRSGLPTHRRFFREAMGRCDREMPRWQEAMQRVARCFERLARGRTVEAAATLRTCALDVSRSVGAPREVSYFLGRAEVRADRPERAEHWFLRLCLADPLYPAAMGFLGDTYILRAPLRAADIAREAEAAFGDDPSYLTFRARFEWELWVAGDRRDAPPTEVARRAHQAVAERPQGSPAIDALASMVRASTLAAVGDRAQALHTLEEAVARNPTHGHLLAFLGVEYLRSDDLARASDALHRANKVLPHAALIEGLLGKVALAEDNARDTSPYFEDALSQLSREAMWRVEQPGLAA